MNPQDAVQALQGSSNPAGRAMFSQPPKDGKMQFYLIRHGATDLNTQGGKGPDRVRGWRNVPLNEIGHKEAAELGQKLAGSGIRVLVHSDLDRARDTAQAIAQTTGARMVPTPLLRPWNVGIYTGKDSNASHPELHKFATKFPDQPIPEGESFNDFKNRAFQGLQFALKESQGEPMGLVTHHRVERLYNAWKAAGEKPDLSIDDATMFSHGEDPATVEKFDVDPQFFGLNAQNQNGR